VSRPVDWYPLETSGGGAALAGAPTLGGTTAGRSWGVAPDPVPGDPAAVRAEGERYQRVADQISRTAAALRQLLSGSATHSEAVDQLRTSLHDVAEDIEHAHDRYATTGSALVTYSTALGAAQSDSLDAYHRAAAAQRVIDAAPNAIRKARTAQDEASDDGDDVALAAAKRAEHAARGDLHDADAALRRAQEDLDTTVAARNAAARAAIDAIDAIRKADKLHDSFQENFVHFLHDVSKVAGTIAVWVGVAAAFLAWVPVLGEVLEAVALIAGAVALIADLTLLVMGDGSWSDVVWDAVGIASFGLGRAAGAAIKIVGRGAEAGGAASRGARAAEAAVEHVAAGGAGGAVEKSAATLVIGSGGRVTEATRVWSAAGIKEVAATLRPTAVARDLGKAFAEVPAFARNPVKAVNVGIDAVAAAGVGTSGATRAASTMVALTSSPEAAKDALRVLTSASAVDAYGSTGTKMVAWLTDKAVVVRTAHVLLHPEPGAEKELHLVP